MKPQIYQLDEPIPRFPHVPPGELVANIRKAVKLCTEVITEFEKAQAIHMNNIMDFEKETDLAKKEKLLNNLQESAIKLGIAKHKAKYYGFIE